MSAVLWCTDVMYFYPLRLSSRSDVHSFYVLHVIVPVTELLKG